METTGRMLDGDISQEERMKVLKIADSLIDHTMITAYARGFILEFRPDEKEEARNETFSYFLSEEIDDGFTQDMFKGMKR